MNTCMSWESLKLQTVIYKFMNHFITVIQFFKFLISLKCKPQSNILIHWYHLCNTVTSCIWNLHSSSDIPDNTSCLQCTECYYLAYSFTAVFVYHIFNNFATSFIRKVHVYIGHGNSLGI